MNIDDLKYGEYCGMNAIYTPTIEVSQKKIAKFFSKFDFLQVAKALCELAINLLDQNTNLYISTPYSNDTLCKAFNLAIRFAKLQEYGVFFTICGLSSTTNRHCKKLRKWSMYHTL